VRLIAIVLCMFLSVASHAAQNSNQALSDLSVMFFDEPLNPIFGIELLDSSKLDFSVNSLGHVDDFLESVRKMNIDSKDRLVLVLRTGAYVGEVLRKNDKNTKWSWLSFKQASKLDKETFEKFGKSISTVAILHSEGKFVFPLGKVEKYLINGSEDSVKYFVEVILTDPGLLE